MFSSQILPLSSTYADSLLIASTRLVFSHTSFNAPKQNKSARKYPPCPGGGPFFRGRKRSPGAGQVAIRLQMTAWPQLFLTGRNGLQLLTVGFGAPSWQPHQTSNLFSQC